MYSYQGSVQVYHSNITGNTAGMLEVVCILREDPRWSRTVSLLRTEQPIKEVVYRQVEGTLDHHKITDQG